MAENGQPKIAGEEEEEKSVTIETINGDELDCAKIRLRKRWELASVLNFFGVFEPVIEANLKMTAEEIEMALIKPDASLAKIHVALLKGIPPVHKNITKPDVWVTILCKKLAEWWSWVAEGDIPLSVDKGEELSRYKELDPTERLLMLKALCEVRAEQDDFASYINDMLKQGSEPSSFRKSKVGEDGQNTNTSYWYDGNDVIGHRLYREVNKYELKSKHRSKKYTDPPVNNLQWDTLATNLDEFRKVLDDLSSSKVDAEVAVCEVIESNVIPVLEKIEKKKERALKRQQRQDTLLTTNHVYVSGVTRSCRMRKPVNYTFDDYDHAIDEAIKITKKRYTDKREEGNDVISDTESDDSDIQKDGSVDSMDTDHKSDVMEEEDEDEEDEEGEEEEEEEEENATHSEKEFSSEEDENDNKGDTKSLNVKIQEPIKADTNGSIEVFTRRLNSLRNNSNGNKSAVKQTMESSTTSDSDHPSQQDNSQVAADSEDET